MLDTIFVGRPCKRHPSTSVVSPVARAISDHVESSQSSLPKLSLTFTIISVSTRVTPARAGLAILDVCLCRTSRGAIFFPHHMTIVGSTPGPVVGAIRSAG